MLALCVAVVSVNSDSAHDIVLETPVPEDDFLEVVAQEDSTTAADLKKEDNAPVKGEGTLRHRIKKAIKVASESLQAAHGKQQKDAAKAAVKAALADAGIADADNAGTIAWANRNLDLAKAWAVRALGHDAKSLGKVAAYVRGAKADGLKHRTKAERALQAMVAVAAATKNKEMVARENKLREEGKLKRYDSAIRNARDAAHYAAKSVTKARAALAMTLGNKARIAAKHALVRAQEAVREANKILDLELTKKNSITENRLQSDGARMVGENELHYRARKTFHKANRVLKLVTSALDNARKNSFAHKEAETKRQQKLTMEKATKLQAKEHHMKDEEKRKAKGIKTKEEYAAYLAKEALKFGQVARDDAKKAAEAGKMAAEKAEASARVKAALGIKSKTSTAPVTEALERESIAADLAAKAASMESAIVTGEHIPKIVQELIMDHTGKVKDSLKQTMLATARARAQKANVNIEDDEDFHEFVTHRKKWMTQYKQQYEDKVTALKAKKLPGSK
jgi:hypothetical protein